MEAMSNMEAAFMDMLAPTPGLQNPSHHPPADVGDPKGSVEAPAPVHQALDQFSVSEKQWTQLQQNGNDSIHRALHACIKVLGLYVLVLSSFSMSCCKAAMQQLRIHKNSRLDCKASGSYCHHISNVLRHAIYICASCCMSATTQQVATSHAKMQSRMVQLAAQHWLPFHLLFSLQQEKNSSL